MRHQLALDSLDANVSLLELSAMLFAACVEADAEQVQPESDAAIALIAARVGFASPADTMSREKIDSLIAICQQNLSASITLNKDMLQ